MELARIDRDGGRERQDRRPERPAAQGLDRDPTRREGEAGHGERREPPAIDGGHRPREGDGRAQETRIGEEAQRALRRQRQDERRDEQQSVPAPRAPAITSHAVPLPRVRGSGTILAQQVCQGYAPGATVPRLCRPARRRVGPTRRRQDSWARLIGSSRSRPGRGEPSRPHRRKPGPPGPPRRPWRAPRSRCCCAPVL